MGDALAFVDPADPAQGWMLEGRLADDFKLSTGTWVRVGPLRARLLALAGDLVQDVVIAGEGRDHVAALVLPGLAACRRLAGDDTGALSPPCCARIRPSSPGSRALLRDFSAAHPGSSTALTRAILLDEPPSIDAQEITDKGSLNQRAVLRRRAHLVDELYGEAGSPRVIDSSKGLT